MFKSFIKDPFVHFLLIGVTLYIGSIFLEEKEVRNDEMILSTQEIDVLKMQWEKSWNRSATSAELASIMIQKQQDERLFEEAIAMGLYKEDTVIYERLLSKIKHSISEVGFMQQPDSVLLEEYYKSHHDNYRKNGYLSFSHLFISIHHDNPMQKAKEMRILLQETDVKAEDVALFGDYFEQTHIKNMGKDAIDKIFGRGFYKQLSFVKKGRWSEALISSLGVHLVFITQHKGGEVVPYESIKGIVKSDFLEDTQLSHYKSRLQNIMQR